ncbi:MAG: hypothetical protein AAGU32_02445 [Bacillota bacterium]
MQKIEVIAPIRRRNFWQTALWFWGLEAAFCHVDSPITICDNSDANFNNWQPEDGRALFVCGSLPHHILKETTTATEAVKYNNGTKTVFCPQLDADMDGFISGDILLFLLDCFQLSRRRIVTTTSNVLTSAFSFHYHVAENKLTDTPKHEHYPVLIREGNILYSPLNLSDFEYVLQPEIPFFKSNPFVVQNYALLRFIKAALVSLSPALPIRSLWPGNASCCVSVTGDVHDYSGIPGREDREHKDMLTNCDLLRDLGLEGRAAWYCSAYIAERHPDTFKSAFSRGYEIQPHTYLETQYALEEWDFARQKNDIMRCYAAFDSVSNGNDIFRKGFRTHGYQSDFVTREVLDVNGSVYLADLQAWETPDNLSRTAYEKGILYFGLPQKARGRNGRPLNLLEIPDTVPNDHVLYRLFHMTPEQSFDFWKARFDRILRLGGYFQTCLHPYISLFEAAGRKDAYIELIRHMKSKGAAFMLPIEVSQQFYRYSL